MKEKFLRSIIILSSLILFFVSGGIVYWIGQSEEERLELVERFTFEKNNPSLLGDLDLATEKKDSLTEVDLQISEIEVLLSQIGTDNLSGEE